MTQQQTSMQARALVLAALKTKGLAAVPPQPKLPGVQLMVHPPGTPGRNVRIKIVGRGEQQTSTSYRWFQIRVPEKTVSETIAKGYPSHTSWERHLRLVDFVILVSLHHDECWVLDRQDLATALACNREHYASRPDNARGTQAELDLDILCGKEKLHQRLKHCLNNWQSILDIL